MKKGMSLIIACAVLLTGCQGETIAAAPDAAEIQTESESTEEAAEEAPLPESKVDEREAELLEAAETYRELYEASVSSHTLGSLTMLQSVVGRLGEQGYTAVDTENQNQVNMVHPEPVVQFCEQAEAGLTGEVVFFSAMEDGGLIRYDLTTDEGRIYVTRDVLQWEENVPRVTDKDFYEAYNWNVSEEGYLFFEKELPAGYDGAAGYTAIRVQPLDDRCRELNRRYILPVGYRSNTMFLSDWSEADFSEFDFDDMFDVLYSYVYGTATPYEQAVDGAQYDVPEEEFETVIESYFCIDTETLRKYTRYSAENKTYQFRTRSFADSIASPNIPYPEVVGYVENEDGTVTLTVNVVWPEMHLSKAFSHEVVVRPLENGKFQYVSNHIIPSEDNAEPTWY